MGVFNFGFLAPPCASPKFPRYGKKFEKKSNNKFECEWCREIDPHGMVWRRRRRSARPSASCRVKPVLLLVLVLPFAPLAGGFVTALESRVVVVPVSLINLVKSPVSRKDDALWARKKSE